MSKLQLADDLSLPRNAVTETFGFLGRRGSGKSYAATKLAELMHDAGAQFVAIDPVGIWWGLRLAADGKGPGLDVPIFGGLHGDIPLEPTAGAMLADVVIDRGVSAVLDVSQFEADTDKARFARDFAARFFYRKKASPSAVHVFVEEAQEFIPQNPQKGEEQMLHAWQRMIRLGRNYGIGMSMLSQRPQDVNKKALNQTEALFCFQLTGPQERKAVELWIAEKGLDGDLNAILPALKQGYAHAWSPVWLDINREVHISEKRTFAAGSTPKVGERPKETKPLAPIELEKLREDMKATIEKAKGEDPRFLKAELAKVKAQLAKVETAAPAPAKEKRVEVPVVTDAQVKRIEKIADRLEAEGQKRIEEGQRLRTEAQEFRASLAKAVMPLAQARPPIRLAPSLPVRPLPQRLVAHKPNDDGSGLPEGERKVLVAAAQNPEGASREQISILAGYKRSTRDAYIQRLSTRGLVVEHGGAIVATEDGKAALGTDFEPFPTGDALRDYWLRRLPEGERKCFEVVIGAYPSPVDREIIGEHTGYKRSTRDAYLQRLGTRRLVKTVGRGEVVASETLFD